MSEPLDPMLEALYREERARPPSAPPGARERVLEGVLARIGGGGGSSDPSGPAPVGSPSVSLGKPALAGLMFAAGLIVGAGLGATLAPREVLLDHPSSSAVAPETPQATASPLELAVEKAPPISAGGDRRAPPPAPPRRAPAAREVAPDPSTALDHSTAEERALIDRARSALRRGDSHEALVTLMGHQRRFPSGALAAVRERLIVEALVAAGRNEQARARIDAYVRSHPSGIHRAALERIASGLPR